VFDPNAHSFGPGPVQTMAAGTNMQTMAPANMKAMSALAGRPERPQFAMGGDEMRDMTPDQRMEALMGFRGQMNDWRMDLRNWRQQNRGHPNGQGNPNVGGGGLPQTLPAPVGQPVPAAAPANTFPGMVGQSLYVQGMRPAVSPFDLPTY
jgi:hypothetical protein